MSMIPPLGARGVYEVLEPWEVNPNISYRCSALRYFLDLENQDIDVYAAYYEPHNLSRETFEQDRVNQVAIVTLLSDTQTPIYIPSSYIKSYPNSAFYNYQHIVLSASLGPLPDDLDLTFLKNQMKEVISDVIGVEPIIHENVAPSEQIVTPAQHEILEANRQSAITNRTTTHSKNLTLIEQRDQLSERVQILEQLVIDNDLLN